ncbi:MAG: hypothetical protein ACM3JQ_02830 [Candidatus Eiseniibacteriota bacterium]
MKRIGSLILTVIVATAFFGAVVTMTQSASAPRDCAGCTAFKKLTHEFEKSVIDAATTGDPNLIPGLIEQYSNDFRALDFGTR